MSSHGFTIGVYLMFLAALLALALLGRRPRSRIPSFDDLVRRAVGTRPRRIGVVVTWVWLGLHFFAR